MLIHFQHQYIMEYVFCLIFLLSYMSNSIFYINAFLCCILIPKIILICFLCFFCKMCFSLILLVSLTFSLMINNSTKYLLFKAYGDTLISLITVPSLASSSSPSLSSSFLLSFFYLMKSNVFKNCNRNIRVIFFKLFNVFNRCWKINIINI